MRRIFLLLSLAVLIASCHKPVRLPVFQVPVLGAQTDSPVTVFPATPATGPVRFDNSPRPDERLETVIRVPPSTTETVVNVYKKKVNPIVKALTNAPSHEVTATNPGVTADQPHKTVWPRWVALVGSALLLLALIVLVVARKMRGLTPAGLFTSIIKKAVTLFR